MRFAICAGVCAGWASVGLADVPRVAVDIAPVHSVVAAVMGDVGEADLVLPPGASPHGYSMRPSEARAVSSADLIVWMGPALTPWLDTTIDALGADSNLLTLLSYPETELLDVREGATFVAHDHDHGEVEAHDAHDDHAHDEHAEHKEHDEHAHDDHDEHAHDDHDEHAHDEHAEDAHGDHDHDAHDEHAHDDHDAHDEHAHDENADEAHAEAGHAEHAHSGTDPHAWLDPRNASVWADAIADALSEIDPDNAAAYASNAAQFRVDMAELETEIASIVSPVSCRPFVVFHDAYHYFEHRFEIEAVGAVSASDAAAPSPARVAELRDEIAELGAVCALSEPQFNPGILNALGDVRLGEVDPLGVTLTPGPALYPDLIRNMATTLKTCLE